MLCERWSEEQSTMHCRRNLKKKREPNAILDSLQITEYNYKLCKRWICQTNHINQNCLFRDRGNVYISLSQAYRYCDHIDTRYTIHKELAATTTTKIKEKKMQERQEKYAALEFWCVVLEKKTQWSVNQLCRRLMWMCAHTAHQSKACVDVGVYHPNRLDLIDKCQNSDLGQTIRKTAANSQMCIHHQLCNRKFSQKATAKTNTKRIRIPPNRVKNVLNEVSLVVSSHERKIVSKDEKKNG